MAPVFNDAFFITRLDVCKKQLIPARKEFSMAMRKLKYWQEEYDLCERRLSGVNQLDLFEGGDKDVKA